MPQSRTLYIPWGRDFATLRDRHASATAVVTADGACTYGETFGRAAGLAARLTEAGVVSGEPVITFLRNGAPAVWASYGISLAGAAETSLNAHLSPSEVAHCVRVTKARHAVTDAASAPLFRDLGCCVHVATESEEAAIDASARVRGDAWGRILFTSGTTGLPKAIVHSHFTRWLSTLLLRAHLPQTPDGQSRILLMTPYSHGASLLTYAYLDHGASVHLMDGVNVARVRDLLRARAVTDMFAPPTVLAKLTTAFAGERFAGLRCIFTGTSTLTPQIYEKTRAMFGPIVRVTYGKSEMLNPITVLPPRECEAYYANPLPDRVSLGWPATGVEIMIMGDDGRPCARGSPGEVHIRSPHLMVGQIDRSGFRPVGEEEWHATGDIGILTADGALHLVGRAHDVIKTGGHKVYPQEIELALEGAVAPGAVAVVGVPSEYWGQVMVAVVEGAGTGFEDALAGAAEALAKYKRPRAYLRIAALPRGAQDKVRRPQVVEELQRSYRLVDGPHPQLVPREGAHPNTE